ncbi:MULTISPECIES: FAD-binding oxidoreductase [unclassified Leclercia]|uniref:FAD-binding oxidoreductase n=1 Tax=Leclercia barmai TaxID=2785629 RepID=A0ABS7RYP0_9ENTR|nr:MULTISPECIES: FAD-binding oxidoreductase [unclassified Leclercia]MBZ0059428.1 FAD-binding oxidoreductase [Leclercia sp. EMC7]MCM5697439.1 FAD-binding oxidoreductase [Leclercia sp. LTM01]MCM5701968.1 FAD-binding oxidoreductase [Leclercia sp. LTM14]
MKHASIPFNHNQVGWPEGQQYAPHPSLQSDITADWVVVGAGFAGVAFARRMSELDASLKIVLVDAFSSSESSSARNSGFVIGLPHNIGSSTAELEKAQSYRNLLQEGIRQLKRVTVEHGINCDWDVAGKYHCQVEQGNDKLLDEYAHHLDMMDEPWEVIGGGKLYNRLGTRFYSKAIYTPGCVLVNPAQLIKGLRHTLPENVLCFDNTPVMGLQYGKKVEVLTPFGTITADRVMLATNSLSPELAPGMTRQASMATFASITEPLTDEQLATLPTMQSWGLTPVNAIAGATFRFTRDKRFLIRQHVTPALKGKVDAAQTYEATLRHQQLFNKVYPTLQKVRLTQTWSGTISVTRNGAPVWARLNKHLYTAGGCNGAGVSKQTIAGSLLADRIMKYDNPLIEDMISLGRANFLPPSPLLDIGIAGSLFKERYLGRNEI